MQRPYFLRLRRWPSPPGRTAQAPGGPAEARRRSPGVLGVAVAVAALALPSSAAAVSPPADVVPDRGPSQTRLHLVTLVGPGTAGRPAGGAGEALRQQMLRDQRELGSMVGSADAVYRWTTALNGMALELTPGQAGALARDSRVALVEPSAVRDLTGLSSTSVRATRTMAGRGPGQGGRGTVVGVIDSGIAPESPSFATLPSLGPLPRDFTGTCAAGPEWPRERCGGKIAAARWYAAGYGRGALRSTASLSPRDDQGHGTQMAALAAGNAATAVRLGGRRVGTAGGQAPDARLAIYKACWTAPDPADDGCASADLVAAVDQAVADGVDVLALSVAGPGEVDTLERALLGAAEADVVVLGSAGNNARRSFAAHPSPWVTTVGAAKGRQLSGRIRVRGPDGRGPTLTGATSATRAVEDRPMVLSTDVRAPGASPEQARVCAAHSLEAAAVAGRVVVCERGAVGRVDKSATIRLADGVGMVLVNDVGGSTFADFHSVPTLHLDAAAGRELRGWLSEHPGSRATIRPAGSAPASGLAPWSPPGDPGAAVLKPDLVAPATGLVAPVPRAPGGTGWDVVAGTSAATAWTAGAAARVRALRSSWSAVQVRSALATRATALRGGGAGLRAGAGRAAPDRAARARLTYPEPSGSYRAWLSGRRSTLNPPSVLLSGARRTTVRTVRNDGARALYFSSGTTGVRGVSVTPAAVRLSPGEQVTFRVTATPAAARGGHGHVVWRGGDGSRSRIPIVLTR